MSCRPTSPGSPSATSSPASGSGATPSGSPAGPTTDLFGQALAPASPSATPARVASSTMLATYGRLGSGSSASASLSLALASRLQARTRSLGSTMFRLTWKARVTPSGRSIPALRASERPISDSACSSLPRGEPAWPTPTTHDVKGRDSKRYGEDGIQPGRSQALMDAVSLVVGWSTPSARDWEDSPGMSETGTNPDGSERTRLDQLPRQAALVVSPRATPRAEDSESTGAHRGVPDTLTSQWRLVSATPAGWPTPNTPSGGRSVDHVTDWTSGTVGYHNGRKVQVDLQAVARLASARPTPTRQDSASSGVSEYPPSATHHAGTTLTDAARLTDSGPMPSGSPAETAKPGQLNPAMSRWLMGLPPCWDECAPDPKALWRKK